MSSGSKDVKEEQSESKESVMPSKEHVEERAADSKRANEDNKENSIAADLDIFPPTPTSVKPIVEFTSEDTVNMDTSADRKEDDISLIVHVDESANEFDDTVSNASGTSVSTASRARTPVVIAPIKDDDSTTPVKSQSKDSVEVDIVVIADESIEDASQKSDEATASKDSDVAADNKTSQTSNDMAASTNDQEGKTDKKETRLVSVAALPVLVCLPKYVFLCNDNRLEFCNICLVLHSVI